MKRIRLQISGLSSHFQDRTSVFVVILDADGFDKKMPIRIGETEAQAIAVHTEGIEIARPLTHELLVDVIMGLGAEIVEIEIYKLEQEIFYTKLLLEQTDGEQVEVECRASDALTIAAIIDCPIYAQEEVLLAASVDALHIDAFLHEYDAKDQFYGMGVGDLEKRLQKAVKVEDYEMAANIRDRIKAIKQQEENS
jgi:bifunctional DNase/RNase